MSVIEELLNDASVSRREDANNYRDIATLFSSHANSKGGTVIFGVRENGKLKGINPQTIIEDINYALDNYCDSSIECKYVQIIEGRHLLLEVLISEGSQKVYTEKNELKVCHCNIQGEPVIANKIVLKVWSFESGRSELKVLDGVEEDIEIALNERKSVSLSMLYKNISTKNSIIEIALAQLIFRNKVEVIRENYEIKYSISPTKS